MKRAKVYLFLHLLLALYSISSVLSKLAAGEPFLSLGFCLCYAGMIALLGAADHQADSAYLCICKQGSLSRLGVYLGNAVLQRADDRREADRISDDRSRHCSVFLCRSGESR